MNKKILFAFLSLLISVPIISSAQNADIDPQGDSSCVSISNNLRYRSTDAQTGGDVSVLQDFLQASGHLKASPSGYFGLLTVKAVKSFQSANGISPTGYVGPLTRAKIQSDSCGGTSVNVPTNSSSNNQSGNTPAGCPAGAVFSYTTGALCSGAPTVVTQAQNKAVITSIDSAGNPAGTITANEKASIHGTGLSGKITIKIGQHFEPQTVTVTGTSDTYAEFTVPSRTQAAAVSVTVTNASGVTSSPYQVNITVPRSTTDSSYFDAFKNAKMVVYSPASGSALQVGGTYSITWSETPADSSTVYTIRDYVNQSLITTINRSQAGCAASDICKYSWTPTQTSLNNYITVSDYANSVYGQSGTFSVNQNRSTNDLGCPAGAVFSYTTGALCPGGTQVQNKAVITSIDSAGNPVGTITANEKASLHGTGLSGRLTIKLGNQEPQVVTVTGTSDTYAEFTVPSRTQAAAVSVTVTNASGVTSSPYQVNITVKTSASPVINSINQYYASGGETIILYGTNLNSGSIVQLSKNSNLIASVTNTQSSNGNTQLSFVMDARVTSNITPGVYQLNVLNGSSRSNLHNFTLSNQEPFRVTYPTEGATLDAGRTYTLTWTGSDLNQIYYTVRLIGGPYGTVNLTLGTAYVSTKSFTFTIPAPQDSVIWPGPNYRIQVGGQNDTGGISPTFNIRDPNPRTPSDSDKG